MMIMTGDQYLYEQFETKFREFETQAAKESSYLYKVCEEIVAEGIRKADELIQKLEEMTAAEETQT